MHRDIKPANILYDEDKDIYVLSDLGAAIQKEEAESNIGTPLYMAPEILYECKNYD